MATRDAQKGKTHDDVKPKVVVRSTFHARSKANSLGRITSNRSTSAPTTVAIQMLSALFESGEVEVPRKLAAEVRQTAVKAIRLKAAGRPSAVVRMLDEHPDASTLLSLVPLPTTKVEVSTIRYVSYGKVQFRSKVKLAFGSDAAQPHATDKPGRMSPKVTSVEKFEQQAEESIVETATPSSVIKQLERAAKAREALATEFGLLSSSDIARLSGSNAANKAATAHRWQRSGRIFNVETGRGEFYPGFQFENGVPRPHIAPVVAAFDGSVSGWSLALWFVSANGWLGGLRPVDVIDTDEASVIRAAKYARDEIL